MTDAEQLAKFKEAVIKFTFLSRSALDRLNQENKAMRAQLKRSDKIIDALLNLLPNIGVIEAAPPLPKHESYWPKDLLDQISERTKA